MTSEIYLPRDSRDASIDLIIVRCVNFFGTEVGKFYDEKMQSAGDPDWLKKLGMLRQDYRINLFDPTFVLKEPLFSDSPLRKFLPRSQTFYNNLDAIRKLRNRVVHNDYVGNISNTLLAVQIFFDVVSEMELSHAINQYATLMTRLREIEKGVTFDAEREVQENQAEKEKAFLEDRISELNEMVEEFQEKYEKREFEINELKSNYEVQLTNLENNSEKLEEMKKLLIQKEEIESKLMEENELEKSRLIEIETEREQLRQVTSLLTQIVMDDNKLEQFRMKVQDSSPEFQSISSSDYAVGGIWTKEKGKKKLILSVKQRDLIDPVTDEPVNSIDSESRKKLAEQWLRIRPSGGRIFIDDQGNASTLLGENLIYLGNLKKG